jgi:hypothetical protein
MDTPRDHGWLTLIYRVPSKPSTVRVAVWKQAKELGGLPLQQSAYVFPDFPKVRFGVAQLRRQIEQSGGESNLLEVPAVDETQQRGFIEESNRLRDEEYSEVIEDCEALIQQIERKSTRGRFDGAEAEDARRDLERVRDLFATVEHRDYFGAGRHGEIVSAIERAEAKLSAYEQRAAAEGAGASVPEAASATPAGGKQKERGLYSRADVVPAAEAVLGRLADGSLQVGELQVGELPDSVVLELKYADRGGKRKLEIEFEW